MSLKCSKSQARRMVTARSGRPRWGRHGWLSMAATPCSDLWCLMHWSITLSRGVCPRVVPAALTSFSPSAFLAACSCATIPSLRLRKCLDIVLAATAVYAPAALSPATASNPPATALICSQYLLYLLSTCTNTHEYTYRALHQAYVYGRGKDGDSQ
uniref:Uncharacterized protein n=3 Tax=Oryza TaxID=4527 RepID=A0A0E0NP11_ORYRU